MSSDLEYQKIRYKNKYYAVINMNYREHDLPVIIDWKDLKRVKDLNKTWKVNKYGFAYCLHTYDNVTREVYLHEVIIALRNEDLREKTLEKPIIHLNKVGLDNRRDNLIYDIVNKERNKSSKKKSRTITFPSESGINVNDIPTYVWYMKPNGSHGSRFMVEVGDVTWKTTSSKKFSLAYKLEEAKKFLRELKCSRPDLFENHSMNGDYTKMGAQLLESFYDIIERANYDNIVRVSPPKKTDQILKPGMRNIKAKERQILKSQGNFTNKTQNGGRRRVINNLPKELASSKLPKYCYYRPQTKTRGDYFVIENHPLQDCRVWQTTSSKRINTLQKYNQMIVYLSNL